MRISGAAPSALLIAAQAGISVTALDVAAPKCGGPQVKPGPDAFPPHGGELIVAMTLCVSPTSSARSLSGREWPSGIDNILELIITNITIAKGCAPAMPQETDLPPFLPSLSCLTRPFLDLNKSFAFEFYRYNSTGLCLWLRVAQGSLIADRATSERA